MANVVPQTRPIYGDENSQPIIIAFTIWTVVLSGLFVIARVVVRLRIVKIALWWDDWFIIAAQLATLIGGSLDFVEVHFGFGRHEYYLSAYQLHWFTAYTYGEWIQTFFTLMCTKVSICLFLIRIPIHRRYTVPLKVAVGLLVVSNVVLTLLWIFQCWPIPSLWDASIKPDRCFAPSQVYNIIFSQAIVSVVSDFGLASYPIIILWHVNMRTKDKIGLCVLMGLGVITGSCCIVRTVLNNEAVPDDATYGGITNWFWRLFEVQLGIICACIPTLIPGYKWLKRRYRGTSVNVSDESTPPCAHELKPKHAAGSLDPFAVGDMLRSNNAAGGPKNTGYNFSIDPAARRNESDATVVPTSEDLEYDQIRKTTQVSVDHNAIQREPHLRPSLNVDLRPSFDENRGTFNEIVDAYRHAAGDMV